MDHASFFLDQGDQTFDALLGLRRDDGTTIKSAHYRYSGLTDPHPQTLQTLSNPCLSRSILESDPWRHRQISLGVSCYLEVPTHRRTMPCTADRPHQMLHQRPHSKSNFCSLSSVPSPKKALTIGHYDTVIFGTQVGLNSFTQSCCTSCQTGTKSDSPSVDMLSRIVPSNERDGFDRRVITNSVHGISRTMHPTISLIHVLSLHIDDTRGYSGTFTQFCNDHRRTRIPFRWLHNECIAGDSCESR